MIMAWLRTKRTVHDVERGSNLDLLIRGFHGIGNRFVDAVGGGLQAIALALSTPNDNSAEVREQVKRLQAARESLQQSIDNEGE
jgi:hypothetical protein